jgi:hypothetical protein
MESKLKTEIFSNELNLNRNEVISECRKLFEIIITRFFPIQRNSNIVKIISDLKDHTSDEDNDE